MNGTLFWANRRKRITGLVIEISACGKSGGTAGPIIADTLLPAGTVPPPAGTVLLAEFDGKAFRGTVIHAEKTDANSSFVRMEITVRPEAWDHGKALPSPRR